VGFSAVLKKRRRAKKVGENLGVFDSNYAERFYMGEKIDRNIGFQKSRQFFLRKIAKIISHHKN
jgi:hypothetical protein